MTRAGAEPRLSPSRVVTGNNAGQFWVRHLEQDHPHFVTGPPGRILTLQIDPHGHWIAARKFPGWKNEITWQEWYSDEYLRNPPWRARVDCEAVRAGGR
jgi:hypothetical protein